MARDLPLSYGIESSWAPDSRRLAFIRSGSMSKGEISVITLADGQVRTYTGNGAPSFDQGDGEHAPLWDEAGANLHAIGVDGKLWRVDASSGAASMVGEVPGRIIRAIIAKGGQRLLWTDKRRKGGVGHGPPTSRVPIGSSFGQNCFAALWLTMTTVGASNVSDGVNARPGDERLAEGLEVVRRRDPEADLRRRASRRQRMALAHETAWRTDRARSAGRCRRRRRRRRREWRAGAARTRSSTADLRARARAAAASAGTCRSSCRRGT